MNEQPSRPTKIDQSGQTVLGNQINIAGDLNTTWPRVATTSALVALLAFALLFIELATNAVERLSGLSLQALLIIVGIVAAVAWLLALFVRHKQSVIVPPIGNQKSNRTCPDHKISTFVRWSRRIAHITLWVVPILIVAVAVAYYTWRVIPARYTTILLADFVAPSGVDDALVTQTLAAELEKTLAGFPTLHVKRLTNSGDSWGIAENLGNLGILTLNQGDYTAARTYLTQSIDLYKSLNIPIPSEYQSGLDTLNAQQKATE